MEYCGERIFVSGPSKMEKMGHGYLYSELKRRISHPLDRVDNKFGSMNYPLNGTWTMPKVIDI